MSPIRSATDVKLEVALERTEFGKFNYAIIVFAGAVLCAVFLEILGINFILPVAQCDLNLTNEKKGILSAIGSIGIIVSSHLWGFLADTCGRKSVIVSTLFIALAMTIISSFIKLFEWLVVMRFLNGFFISGPSATIYAYLGEFHCLKYRSKAMMLGSTMYALFSFLNPFFAWIFINQSWNFYIEPLDLVFKPWRLFMIVCGMPSVVCGLVMLFCLPESPKYTFSKGDEKTTLEILEKIYICNTGKPRETFDVTSLLKDDEFETKKNSNNFFQFVWSQTAPLFKHPHLKNTLTACYMQFCIFNSCNGFWTFFPDITNRMAIWAESDPSHITATVCQILNETRNFANTNETLIDSTLCVTKLDTSAYQNVFILNLVYFFGWLFFASIINRAGKLIILTSTLFTCGLCGLALIFTNHPLVSSYFYVILLSVGLTMTVASASVVDLFPTQLRAMALCLSLMAGRLGSVAASNIIGILLDNYCEYTFLMPTKLLISCGCLAFTIPNISDKISS